MFEKVRFMIRNDGLVSAAKGYCIVGESASCIFCVFPRKAEYFKCDRSCADSRTKTCEHVIVSIEKCEKHQQVGTWFRRSKSVASVSVLSLISVPKPMGRKESNRKRSIKEE